MQEEQRLHNELMFTEELDFLIRKDEKDTRLFYGALRVLMIICFIIPFIVAWFRAFNGEKRPFEYGAYFLGVLFLLGFLGLCAWIAYRRVLYKLKMDVKNKMKTIERAKIVRKQYMPHDSKYYFYLDSPNKLSIEVSQKDYYLFGDGDELNIEYSANSKFYFGYF